MQRHAIAMWHGSLKEGSGTITTESKSLYDAPYSFATRFEQKMGANPEELIAAACAGCFTMALNAELEKNKLHAHSIETFAEVQLNKGTDSNNSSNSSVESQNGAQWSINKIHLDVSARVPGATEDQFLQAADLAKRNCPVSKLLKADISMKAHLVASTLNTSTESVEKQEVENQGEELPTEVQEPYDEAPSNQDPLIRPPGAHGSQVPGSSM